jgi:peptidyl-prolyl cis-trans isomerase D
MSARAISNEPKVVGASFNPSNRGKIVPEVIEGRSGVFVVRVDNVSAMSNAQADIAAERRMRYEMGKQTMSRNSPLETLRKAAKIKDRRVNFF